MLAPTTNATNSIYLALFTLIQFPLSHQRNLRLALLGLKAEFGWSLGWRPHHSIGTAPAPLCFYLILINKSSSFSICIITQTGNLGLHQHSRPLGVKLPPSWGTSSSSHLVIPASVIPGRRNRCAAASSLLLTPLMSDTNLLFIS